MRHPRYRLYKRFKYKVDAKDCAQDLREQGFRARVGIKKYGKYSVLISGKRK